MELKIFKNGFRAAIAIAVLSVGGASVAAGVLLPDNANDNAGTNTSDVTLPSQSPQGATEGPTVAGSPSPAAQAEFGQCVAAAASQDVNPTSDCVNTNAGATGASASSQGAENANDSASDGVGTASAGGDNGATNAADDGADNAAAGADNAGTHAP